MRHKTPTAKHGLRRRITPMHPASENHAAGLTELLHVTEAARRLALSRSTVYNLMERGDLAYVKIGRARRIPLEELERLVRDSTVSRRPVVA